MKIKIFTLAAALNFCCLLLNSTFLFSQAPNWAWAHIGEGSDYGNEIANSMVTDASGNVYVAGSFTSSTVTFESYTLSNANSGSGSGDIFFVKYDGSGNVLWAKYAGGNGNDIAYSVARDALGNFFVAGTFSSSSKIGRAHV